MLAPAVGLEPTSLRVTSGCSAEFELSRKYWRTGEVPRLRLLDFTQALYLLSYRCCVGVGGMDSNPRSASAHLVYGQAPLTCLDTPTFLVPARGVEPLPTGY